MLSSWARTSPMSGRSMISRKSCSGMVFICCLLAGISQALLVVSGRRIPMRPESKLNRSGRVRLRRWREHRKIPGLALDEARDSQGVCQHQLSPQIEVLQRAALQECSVDAVVAITKLNIAAWREPVSQPSLLAPAAAPDPAADEIAVIGVAGVVALVPVEGARAEMRWHIHIIGDALKAEIEFWDFWNMGKINAGIDCRPVRDQRRILVDDHRVGVNRQPVS